MYIATIDETTGEILTLSIPGGSSLTTEGLVNNSEPPRRIKHLRSDDAEGWITYSSQDIMENFWWGGESWILRGTKDSPYSDWDVVEQTWKFNSEKFLVNLRHERDIRLLACDWTQASDCQLSGNVQAQWRAYRQILRDIPATYAGAKTLRQIGWPAPPDGSDIEILAGP